MVQDALEQWRAHIFAALGKRSKSAVPISSDIDKLAAARPTSVEELRQKVPLGDRKFEAYGRELLQVRCRCGSAGGRLLVVACSVVMQLCHFDWGHACAGT
jgi:hypothetical protein